AWNAGEPVRLELRDDSGPGRPGWREMLVRAEGIAVQGTDGADVPAKDISDELRAYPEEMLSGPLNIRRLSLTAVPTTGALQRSEASESGSVNARGTEAAVYGQSLARSGDHFAELITSATVSPTVVLLALLTAVVLGSMHALSPGHGKTIVGAYLVGSRGTASHALFLGVTVTVVHTAGVFALLLATLFASQYVLPEQVFPWMSLVSGALVLLIGLSLLRQRLRSSLATHHSSLAHSHGFGSHTHTVPGVDGSPVTWRSLLLLGVSGGLLPCPSAVVLGLGAIALGRVLYGLVLITAFSAGLAVTLMTIGLVMVYSGRAAGRLPILRRFGSAEGRGSRVVRVVQFLPVISSGVVALAGLALTIEAVQQIDLPRVWQESSRFRILAANGLSLSVGALAVYLGLRRGRPAAQMAHDHAGHIGHMGDGLHAHEHGHMHGHNVHVHEHQHGHGHGHGISAQDHGTDDLDHDLHDPDRTGNDHAPSRARTSDAGAISPAPATVPIAH
ncbi:MAG TPA: sulfite exporter TauE/SafE family protein, partial [Chloroflexota bacterium]|nr:sulfite exporter TauE/SafE family protein [Chloroflexota bacterium]